MNDTKFTPGPWIADDGDASSWGVFSDATSDAVCYLYDTHVGAPYATDPIESSANANLIAAAPELYEALKAMAADDAFAELCASIGEEPRWLKSARKALAKAEGVSEAGSKP